MSPAEKRTLDLITDHPMIPRGNLALWLGVSEGRVSQMMRSLFNDWGLVERHGKRGDTRYTLSAEGIRFVAHRDRAQLPTTQGIWSTALTTDKQGRRRHVGHSHGQIPAGSGRASLCRPSSQLTEIRAYVRAHFLGEDAAVNWTEIGAKVKKLVDERISAEVRELMKPVSILDQEFEQKIAALPHDDARASIMEHAIRAQIHERLASNPVFFERLSAQLAKVIEDLRKRVIDSAEACKHFAAIRNEIQSEADIAAQHGLSPVSFAIYQLIDGHPKPAAGGVVREALAAYELNFDDETKEIAMKIESAVERHTGVVDWQSNEDVQRLMRRDIKRALRRTGEYTEERLDELANQTVELARRRIGR